MYSANLIFAATFSPNSLSAPDGWIGHTPFAAWIVREVAPRIFVELGTHTGNSYFSFCQSVAEANIPAKCYAVDSWLGDEQAGYYDEAVFTEVNAYNNACYAGFSRLMRMSFDDATAYFGDGSIELLHIDGLHTYEAVRHDFETWLPKLAPGAVVLFHDTNVRDRKFGVWRLWAELQERYPNNIEFPHSNGLGVLQLGPAPGGKTLPWLRADTRERQAFANYFEALGARQLERFALVGARTHAADLAKAIAGKQARIVEVERVLSETQREIENLKQLLKEKAAEGTSVSQSLDEKAVQIAGLTQSLLAGDGQIAQLSRGAAAKDERIAGLENVLLQREGEIAAMTASRSWRLTKPLRFFGQVTRGELGAMPWLMHALGDLLSEGLVLGRGILRAVTYVFASPRAALRHAWRAMRRETWDRARQANVIAPTRVANVQPGPPAPARLAESSPPGRSRQTLCSISVVIPTYNRGELLSQTLSRCLEYAKGMDVEFIVIDDGSTDDTPRRLAELSLATPNLQWRSTANGGPGQARNLGATMARHDILLFMGDDIQPADSDFFRTHAALHAANPAADFAVLGKVVWPSSDRGFVNSVMSHIQGHGGEQFGYADLVPYTNLDWRFFYTANVSVKRAIVEDWVVEGFDGDFRQAAWDDVEFAYRLKKKHGGFRIFYDPTSVAMHYHRYSAATFIERQVAVGAMAHLFFAKQPDAAEVLGFDLVIQILRSTGTMGSPDLTAEYHSIIEGLKSYVRLIDETGVLGTQPWHDALLAGVFDLAVFQSFVLSWAEPNGRHAAALEFSLRRFRQSMRREAQINFGLHM
jgi:glycosyltransferase involved in cell wall biosynthesis